jgi:hypothetical protein
MLVVEDTLHWCWSVDGIYSSRSAYAALLLGQSAILQTKELWKIKAPNNCRFFIWLALLGRCWTVKRRRRHGLQSSSSCIVCLQETEFIDHLLVRCVFLRDLVQSFAALWLAHSRPIPPSPLH